MNNFTKYCKNTLKLTTQFDKKYSKTRKQI